MILLCACEAFGLPAFVVLKVLVPAFFAHGDTATPVRVGLFSIGLNLLLNVLFMVPLQHVGPALASSLSAIVNVLALAVVLSRRGQLVLDARLRRRLPRMALAALAMAGALLLAEQYVFGPAADTAGLRWLALGVLVGFGLAAYGVAAQALGALDARELLALMRRRSA